MISGYIKKDRLGGVEVCGFALYIRRRRMGCMRSLKVVNAKKRDNHGYRLLGWPEMGHDTTLGKV